MTAEALRLIAKQDRQSTRLHGRWRSKADRIFEVGVLKNSDNGTHVIVVYADGMARQRNKEWFLKNYERI